MYVIWIFSQPSTPVLGRFDQTIRANPMTFDQSGIDITNKNDMDLIKRKSIQWKRSSISYYDNTNNIDDLKTKNIELQNELNNLKLKIKDRIKKENNEIKINEYSNDDEKESFIIDNNNNNEMKRKLKYKPDMSCVCLGNNWW